MLPSDIRPEHVIAARRELARRSLADFACMVDIPTVPLTDEADEDQFSVMRLDTLATHHALLLDLLQRVESGSVSNLMVLMPPGSAKSTYVDVVFVPWFMARQPRRHVILASYASEIAEKQGRRARQLINSRSYHNLTSRTLKSDQKAAHQWTLDNGSEFMAGGLLSGLTGNRAALGIIDDPIRGREAAESETIRDKSWDAYTDDFCSRLIPGAPQIMILTRWHEDDPAGRILPEGWDGQSGWCKGRDGRKWYVLCLPAIADRLDDPLGRKIGETLWPEWFSLEHWEPFKLIPRSWASLYQQKPSPEEGSFFKREWFRRYRKGGEPKHLNYYLTSDHAPGGEADSDYTCARVWGMDPQEDIYLIDGFRGQETLDVSVDRVLGNSKTRKLGEPVNQGLVKRYKPFAWFPEADNNWKSIAGFVTRRMREEGSWVRVEPISPHGASKEAKWQSFQGMAASGRVWIPEGPEGDGIIDIYVKGSGATYDDETDAASLIARAIDMAHPGIVPLAKKAPEGDRWDRAFDKAEEEESWKIA